MRIQLVGATFAAVLAAVAACSLPEAVKDDGRTKGAATGDTSAGGTGTDPQAGGTGGTAGTTTGEPGNGTGPGAGTTSGTGAGTGGDPKTGALSTEQAQALGAYFAQLTSDGLSEADAVEVRDAVEADIKAENMAPKGFALAGESANAVIAFIAKRYIRHLVRLKPAFPAVAHGIVRRSYTQLGVPDPVNVPADFRGVVDTLVAFSPAYKDQQSLVVNNLLEMLYGFGIFPNVFVNGDTGMNPTAGATTWVLTVPTPTLTMIQTYPVTNTPTPTTTTSPGPGNPTGTWSPPPGQMGTVVQPGTPPPANHNCIARSIAESGAANCLKTLVCDAIAGKFKTLPGIGVSQLCDYVFGQLQNGVGVASMDMTGYLAEPPAWASAIPIIGQLNTIAQCGINLPVSLAVAGLIYLECFPYGNENTHGHLNPNPNPRPGICRADPDTKGCLNGGSDCDGGGTCTTSSLGCRCIR